MRPNAISLANYFVDLANEEGKGLSQIALIKRVYIAHGFTLALLERPALDSRYDVVEAWRRGPVIPSVYHSFKHNGLMPIKEKSIITDFGEDELKIITPQLEDEAIKEIATAVWKRYQDMSDTKIVELLHRPGTPWALCYKEGENNVIPDLYTKAFYKKMISNA